MCCTAVKPLGCRSMFVYGGPTRQSLSLEAETMIGASGFAAGSLSGLDYGVALNLSESNGFSALMKMTAIRRTTATNIFQLLGGSG